MATRGVYTFQDETNHIVVYKHWDNYPECALVFIQNALKKAWELPRFEADEFAAAFVATNKERSGDVRLTRYSFPPDMGQDYEYVITCEKGELMVEINGISKGTEKDTLDNLLKKYKEEDKDA